MVHDQSGRGNSPDDARLVVARREIIRRRALIDGATSGPWHGTRLGRLGGKLAVVVSTKQPPKKGFGGQFVLADSDPEARVEDAHFIAAHDPGYALAVLRIADLILDRHARTHTCVMRWTDDGAEVGQYIWPVLLCADVKPVLDLYAPEVPNGT